MQNYKEKYDTLFTIMLFSGIAVVICGFILILMTFDTICNLNTWNRDMLIAGIVLIVSLVLCFISRSRIRGIQEKLYTELKHLGQHDGFEIYEVWPATEEKPAKVMVIDPYLMFIIEANFTEKELKELFTEKTVIE